ncbi:MAG: Bug family tripartite tricarboxylate transporter substrate binding protein [Burkholderiaceae bacterium]
MTTIRNRWVRVLAAFALLSCAGAASAQSGSAQGSFPNRPLKIIVPWQVGGGPDTVTRILAERMSASLGQPVVVENKPGAAGNIGATQGAKASADGYTLLVNSAPMVLNHLLDKSLSFDPIKDFAPLGLMASSPYVLAANGNFAGSVGELVTRAKSNPGKYSYASVGPGTQQNIVGEVFKSMAGVDLTHVPYKGAPQALTDMVGGTVHMMFHGVPVVLPMIKSGQLKGIAVATKARLPLLPEVPTLAEAGFPGIEAAEWYGLVVPAGTPKPIVDLLGKELGKALDAPGIREQLIAKGFEPAASVPPEVFGAFIASEHKRWAQAIEKTGFRLQ